MDVVQSWSGFQTVILFFGSCLQNCFQLLWVEIVLNCFRQFKHCFRLFLIVVGCCSLT